LTDVFPLRFRRFADGSKGDSILFANEVGQFFVSGEPFLERLVCNKLKSSDINYLSKRGMSSKKEGDLNYAAFLSRLAARTRRPGKLSYVILVPTLRCDLACSYCQVSRVAEKAKGFDWTKQRTAQVFEFLDQNCGDNVQIEFQGGEPTLRCDIIAEIMQFCRNRFNSPLFVICTNLSRVSEELKEMAAMDDVLISTSLDGSKVNHQKQRTISEAVTDAFCDNLSAMVEVTNGRVSALPTLDPNDLPDIGDILDIYEKFGMYSIFLRPIFYHGFARKRHPESRELDQKWSKYYKDFVEEIMARNYNRTEDLLEEYYLSLALKKLTRLSENSHVDLRTPNWLGYDHLLIDYDGQLYPSDEARMLARSGQIDLSIGSLDSGIDEEKRASLQGREFNALDPWCSSCVYQSACGSDPIDDLARYGRADVPRPLTAFCQKNMSVFDFAIELLMSEDERVQKSVSYWLSLPSHFDQKDYLL